MNILSINRTRSYQLRGHIIQGKETSLFCMLGRTLIITAQQLYMYHSLTKAYGSTFVKQQRNI